MRERIRAGCIRKTALTMAVLLVLTLPGMAQPLAEEADPAGSAPETGESLAGEESSLSGAQGFLEEALERTYREVRPSYTLPAYTGEAVSFAAETAALPEYASLLEAGPLDYGTAVSIRQGGEAAFSLLVPSDGLYALEVEYYDRSVSTLPVKMKVEVDGAFPFYEMRSQQFESRWTYPEGDFPTDRYNNEIVPESIRVEEWNQKTIQDASGLTDGPFLLELTQGTHVFRFSCVQGNLLIGQLTLLPVAQGEERPSEAPEGHGLEIIEAERISYKNDATIRPDAEYNTDVTPYDAKRSVLNMLSGGSFSEGGQEVSYSFTVPITGWYYVGFRYRQSSKSDFPTFRRVTIDGDCWSSAFENVAFPYDKSFQNKTVTDPATGEKVAVYLEAGERHTLSLKVNLENMAPIIDEVNAIIEEINDLSLQIMKITGNNTQKYRDFELEEYIPDLEERLVEWANRIQALYDELHTYNPDARQIGEFSALQVCKKQLLSLSKRPNDLPKRLNELYQGQNSVGQYLANVLENLYNSPLALDQIYLYQNEDDLPEPMGFFQKLWEGIRRFFYSFFVENYESASVDEDSENLQVWVSRSSLYVEIMQEMADTDFYEKYGIKADLSIMSDEDKLVLARAAGNAPDVALSVTYTVPFELAIRGALLDLKEFDGWEEVASRFKPGLLNTGRVEDGLYSLPETTNFYVLFYRTDILDQLGLSVPDTMQDVKQMLPQLKRYGMDFYSHLAVGESANKSLSMLVPFIYQNGGRFYGDNALDIRLDSEETLDAITEMTQLFTMYDIPFEVRSFYQHFRSGLLPIGVADFNTYIQLLNSAPEIANSWDIAPYPGYMDENGEVQRWTGGGGKSCIIFSDTDKPQEAFDFLDWWTSTETQSTFAASLQTSYGKEYVWNTANVEAFAQLPWNEEHRDVLLEMLDWIVEVPRVPGNYMMERELSNAVNAIVLDGENVRTAIDGAVKNTRNEITRKLEEFGYIQDGQVVQEYKILEDLPDRKAADRINP